MALGGEERLIDPPLLRPCDREEYSMRKLIGFAVAAIAMMAFGAAPASAKWTCEGPEFVCGPAPAALSPKKSKSSTYKSAKKKSYAYSDEGSSGGSYSGKASYYWEPQKVASGGWFNPNAMTAAHKTLPFGTKVRVTNKHNGKSVVVTINDRGPYVAGRVIDLSKAAAHAISMQGAGVVPVSYTVLGKG